MLTFYSIICSLFRLLESHQPDSAKHLLVLSCLDPLFRYEDLDGPSSCEKLIPSVPLSMLNQTLYKLMAG